MNILCKAALLLVLSCVLDSCVVITRSVQTPGVRGVVLDATGKIPVAGAAVSMATYDESKTTARTVSASDGSFTLPIRRRWDMYVYLGGDNLYGGTLSVQHPGFHSQSIKVYAFIRPHVMETKTILLKRNPGS